MNSTLKGSSIEFSFSDSLHVTLARSLFDLHPPLKAKLPVSGIVCTVGTPGGLKLNHSNYLKPPILLIEVQSLSDLLLGYGS